MDCFQKIIILYLITISILTPIIYYTILWAIEGDEISATLSGISFLAGVYIFHRTLGKIKIENE